MTATTQMNQYIPAGSLVVIFRNGQHEWYTTKKDVQVTDIRAEDCPVREVPVLTTTIMGFNVWFLESQIKVELTADQIQAAKNLQLVVLEYDIPVVVQRRGRIVHPSSYLWKYGVRTSWSCWLLPKGSVPLFELNNLTRAGCNWKYTLIDASAAADKLQEAVAALQTERVTAIQSAEDCRVSAQERFNDVDRGSLETRLNRRKADLKRIEKDLAEKLENIRLGAVALGIPTEWVNANTLTVRRIEGGAVKAVATAAKAASQNEAAVVAETVERAEKLGTHEGKVIATQLKNNTIPVDIAKDYVREQEEENGVYSLTEALEKGEDTDGE